MIDVYEAYMASLEARSTPQVASEPDPKAPPSQGSWKCEACQVLGLWQHDPVCWNCGEDPRETEKESG